jgi:uncharacterized integral membrane protein
MTMTDRVPERVRTGDPAPAGRQRSLTQRQVASGVAAVVVAVFALINLQSVTMHWIVGTTHTPLIVLVAICVLVGGGVGFLIGRRGRTPTATDR